MRKKLELCNNKVLEKTVARTGESAKTVDHVINHAMAFVNNCIREGALESVRIPRFGLFRAKIETVQFKVMRNSSPKYTQRIAGGPLQGTAIPREENQTEQP